MKRSMSVGCRVGCAARLCRVMVMLCVLAVCMLCSTRARAADSTWTLNGDGNWNNAAAWDNGEPINSSFNVIIDDGDTAVTVFLNVSRTIANLTIGADDELSISNGQTLTLAGNTVNNAGLITLNSTGSNTGIALSNHVTLTGGGELRLGDSATNHISSNANGLALTNALGHTISGAGNLGVNTNLGLINYGLINADQPTQMLIQTNVGANIGGSADDVRNYGTLQASGGGKLTLSNGDVYNEGVIQALDGSYVDLIGGANLYGGSLTTAGTGRIRVAANTVTLGNFTLTAGSTMQILNANDPNVYGTITNNGTVEQNSTGTNTDVTLVGDLTLAGVGTWHMSGSSFNRISTNAIGRRLVNSAGHTISGSGDLGDNSNMALINQGLIDANQAVALSITPNVSANIDGSADDVRNTGTLRASAGGVLQLVNGHFNNTGGMIQALDGSYVDLLGGAHVYGGQLATSGTGRVRVNDAGVTISDVTITTDSTLSIVNGNDPQVYGTINNLGAVEQLSAGAITDVTLINNLTLTGGGTWSMSSNVNNQFSAAAGGLRVTNTGGHTIQGAGNLGVNSNMALVNEATIDANDPSVALTIQPNQGANIDGSADDVRNSGTMQASGGGTLRLSTGVFSNVNGTIQALNGSNADLIGGVYLYGGDLATAGSGHIRLTDTASNTIATTHLTAGSVMQILNGADPNFEGVFTNDGTVEQNSSGALTDVTLSNHLTLTGSGVWQMSNFNTNEISASANTLTLTNDIQHMIRGSGNLGANSNMALVNKGLIDADQSVALAIQPNQSANIAGSVDDLRNTGTMQASSGGTLQLNNGYFNNDGGVIQALDGNSVVEISDNATVANGTFITQGSGRVKVVSSSASLSNVTLAANSVLQIVDGADPFIYSTFMNNGLVEQNSAGSLTNVHIANPVTMTGPGVWRMSDNPNNVIIANSSTLTLTNAAGHTLEGSGTIGAASNLGLLNQGLINANQSTSLAINPGQGANIAGSPDDARNTGVMQASGGGMLSLLTGQFNNTGGTIQALDGSYVNISNNAAIEGGDFTSFGTGRVLLTSSTASISNVTITDGSRLQVVNGADPYLYNTITNLGVVEHNSSGALTNVTIGNNVTLDGGGVWRMSNDVNNHFAAAVSSLALTNNPTHTIAGSGNLGVNSNMALVNLGLIDADQAVGLTIQPNNGANIAGSDDDVRNYGILRGSGAGGLALDNGRFLNSGTFEALDNSNLTMTMAAVLINNNAGLLSGGTYRAVETGNGATVDLRGTAVHTLASDATAELSGTDAHINVNGTALYNSLATNNGTLRIYDGHHFNMANQLTNNGTVALGGAGLADAQLTSSGNILNASLASLITGHGTIHNTVINHGSVTADGGTLVLGGIIDGQSGDITINPGASLNLSGAGGDSDTDTLNHNGAELNLGDYDILVRVDYNNANFGVGNSFNKYAHVSTTGAAGGHILASDPFTMSSTGDLNFGNLHFGDSATLSYAVNHDGASGASPDVRTAIQTAANSGNITDARLSGAGVTASNLAPIAAGESSPMLDVTFNATDAGALTGQKVHIETNFHNVAGVDVNLSGAVYRLAYWDVNPATTDFGNVRLGSTLNQSVNVLNHAINDGFSERLDAAVSGVAGEVTSAGTAAVVVNPEATSSAIVMNLDASAAGHRSGSMTLSLDSNGAGSSGLGITHLADPTLTASADVFRQAVASSLPTSVDFGIVHVGDSVSQTLNVGNVATADGYSEKLDAAYAGASGAGVGGSGNVANIAAGSFNTTALKVAVDTSAAGAVSGSASFAFQSNGSDFGLGPNIVLAGQSVAVAAQVNNFAEALFAQLGGAGSLTMDSATKFTLDFGTIAQNSGSLLAMLGVTNNAPAINSDTLAGSFIVGAVPTEFTLTNFNSFANVAGGSTLSGLSIGFDDATTGAFSHSIYLNPTSDNASSSTSLAQIQLLITGAVSGANAPVLSTSGDLDFGYVLVGTTSLGQSIDVQNVGEVGSELSGSFGAAIGPFAPNAAQAFGPLGPGETDSRDYTFAPTVLGAASDTVAVTSNGGSADVHLAGVGVAPVAEAVGGDAGYVRVGSTGALAVDVANIGNGNLSGLGDASNLKGSVGAGSGAFAGIGGSFNLADSANAVFNYTFSPTARGLDTELVSLDLLNGNPDGTNTALLDSVSLSGIGVGPVFDSDVTPGGLIDFGEITAGGLNTRDLMLFNITLDAPTDLALTGLSILDVFVTGADAADFSVVGFTPTVIAKGGSLTLMLQFAASGADGLRNALLTILTDEGVVLGGDGNDYTYNLRGLLRSGPVVPTPSGLIGGIVLLAGVACRRRSPLK